MKAKENLTPAPGNAKPKVPKSWMRMVALGIALFEEARKEFDNPDYIDVEAKEVTKPQKEET